MLIVCCGPDSYRAIARAKDLENAFKQKHDVDGRAIERLSFGKEGVEDVIERTAGASLFSPKRFLRADGILSACPKNKQRALIEALSRDVESIVIVSVEEEKPASNILKIFEGVPKVILNEYPILRGVAFKTWALEYAHSVEVFDDEMVQILISRYEGDCWSFSREVMKLSAGASLHLTKDLEQDSVFEIADYVLKGQKNKYPLLLDKNQTQLEVTILLQQSLSYLRTKDGDIQGLPPFLVSKMRHLNLKDIEVVLANAIEAIVLQRNGFMDDQEAVSLLI